MNFRPYCVLRRLCGQNSCVEGLKLLCFFDQIFENHDYVIALSD